MYVTGTTLNLLKFPIVNPKPTALHRRLERLRDEKSLAAEEERLRQKQFKATRSPKYATLMGTAASGQHCFSFFVTCELH